VPTPERSSSGRLSFAGVMRMLAQPVQDGHRLTRVEQEGAFAGSRSDRHSSGAPYLVAAQRTVLPQ